MNALAPTLAILTLAAAPMHADTRAAKLDQTPVPAYTLPDPLVTESGAKVTDVDHWRRVRRPELVELFAREVYGRTPAVPHTNTRADIVSRDTTALGGTATRKQITLRFSSEAPPLNVLIYVPNTPAASGRHPAFLGLSFYGNHTVHADPGITLSDAWIHSSGAGVIKNRATEASRGSDATKWQIETVVRSGYAVVTAYYGDLCPDRETGLAEGVNGWLTNTTTESRSPDAWGALGVWAWGLSRILDYLETDKDIDARRVAVHGHSRLGKAALWAAAQDERFALVISNESGCGGAALSKRIHGETVSRINTSFPHWFAKNFRQYNEREATLPVDQHQLLALIAPRPLYVASAEGDDWADPQGEFLAAQAAQPVYQLHGLNKSAIKQMPAVHEPVGDALRYHIRAGEHDMTAYDWERYIEFADRWLKSTPTAGLSR